MIRFNAGKISAIAASMAALADAYESKSLFGAFSDSERCAQLAQIDAAAEAISGIGLTLSEVSLGKAKKALTEGASWIEVKKHLGDFVGRVQDELEYKIAFILNPGQEARWIQGADWFGEETKLAFPSSADDMAEAIKCLALGRYTACVMHLMRALETPLKLQAKSLGLNPNRDNWGDLLNTIEGEISKLRNGDPEKEFHSAALTQFRFIKTAWRDASMHQRSKYVEEDAEPIMAATKAVMRQLATRLRE